MARPRPDERAQHSGPLRRNCSLGRSPLRDEECDELDLLFEPARSRAARTLCSHCGQFDQIGAFGGLARGRKGCVSDGDTVPLDSVGDGDTCDLHSFHLTELLADHRQTANSTCCKLDRRNLGAEVREPLGKELGAQVPKSARAPRTRYPGTRKQTARIRRCRCYCCSRRRPRVSTGGESEKLEKMPKKKKKKKKNENRQKNKKSEKT
jgi:hypothetical protein